jgi:hypothetical protein
MRVILGGPPSGVCGIDVVGGTTGDRVQPGAAIGGINTKEIINSLVTGTVVLRDNKNLESLYAFQPSRLNKLLL